jgi:hypothetical protein
MNEKARAAYEAAIKGPAIGVVVTDLPSPIKAIKISRRTGQVVSVVHWTTRRAPMNRPARPGRRRTISRQAHGRSASRRGPPSSGESDEPPPAAQPQRPGDEQGGGTQQHLSRPRRTGGDLVPARLLIGPVLDRLAEGGEECTSETPHSGATS